MSGAQALTAILFVFLLFLRAGIGRTAAMFPPPGAYPQTPRPVTPDPDDGQRKHQARRLLRLESALNGATRWPISQRISR